MRVHCWVPMAAMMSLRQPNLAIMPLGNSPGLREAVRQLRRRLRDVRDRMAGQRCRWPDVSCAGMANGDHEAMMLITHEGIDRGEVLDVLHRRWLDVLIKQPEREKPTWANPTALLNLVDVAGVLSHCTL
jgi:hypothetical protein